MAKINEIIYDVKESLNLTSDDTEISNDYILFLYNTKRSKYLRQELNNFQRITDISVLQTLCVKMELVSAISCNLDLDCEQILRSQKKLPKVIESHLLSAIKNVRPLNKISFPFNFVTKERAIFSKHSKHKNSVYCFLDTDGYLYVISKGDEVKLIDCLQVTGVFENPLDLQEFNNCCNCEVSEPCFDYMTSEYPLQPHNIDLIRDEIVLHLRNKLGLPEDKINNGTNE